MNVPPLRVLIVDEHKPTCEIIAAILRSDGYATEVTHNAAQAQRKLGTATYHLLLVSSDDDVISHPRGRRTPALIAMARQKHPGIKVITMSGSEPCEELGADAHLGKPFSYPTLLAVAAQLLRAPANVEILGREASKC